VLVALLLGGNQLVIIVLVLPAAAIRLLVREQPLRLTTDATDTEAL
jgi:hypothetical protein